MFYLSIVCDKEIPFLVDAVHTHWPNVHITPVEADKINAELLRNADVLVVRTRTKVDESLIRDTRLKLICTATIGYEHIDADCCALHGIEWMSCPGCNAQAVCDYVEEALRSPSVLPLLPSSVTPTIGVVGVGHVGSLVALKAAHKGWNVLLNDPPKRIGVSLDEIAKKCDIITFHVPLDKTTYHLCDAAFLQHCKPGALIINAARGGVVDEHALLHSGHPYILDTWENEPDINPEVLEHALLASMHIAGYSVEGKRNATQMCLDSIAEKFNLPHIVLAEQAASGDSAPGWLERISTQLKTAPAMFEHLRKTYKLR